jgi:zinc/manganese transport system permease protein
VVLPRQSFAGHTFALVGFAGAAAGVWLGIGLVYGYFAACIGAALNIAAVPHRVSRGYTARRRGRPTRDRP